MEVSTSSAIICSEDLKEEIVLPIPDDVLFMEVDPTAIKVKEGLERIRTEMGDIKKLSGSFDKYGQMQTVLVNRNLELIAGGRRLAACLETKHRVKVLFSDITDPIIMREMELEENIQRKSLTAAEEIMAISELHELKQKIHGETTLGKEGGWTMQQTAETIGKTRASVSENLDLAEALKNFPVLGTCKTKSDIKRAMKGLRRISESVTAITEYEKTVQNTKELYALHHVDCLEFMKTIKDKSVDVLFTDPPYGIDIHKTQIALGGKTGGELTTAGFKYNDDFDESMRKIQILATESARFVKDNGFAVVFCAVSNFWIVRPIFEAAGWDCSRRFIVWGKNDSGQNNAPDKWMTAGYETMLFARKIDSKLVLEGKVDLIQVPNVTPSKRIHHAEKPVLLLKEVLSRLCLPGAVVVDPFVGSCALIEAAIELKLFPIGCEHLLEAYSTGKQRIINYLKAKGLQ